MLSCPALHPGVHEPHAPRAQGQRAGEEQAVLLRDLRSGLLLPLQPQLAPEQGAQADNGADVQMSALSVRDKQQERDAPPLKEQPQEDRSAQRGVELQVQALWRPLLEHRRANEAHLRKSSGRLSGSGEMLSLPPHLSEQTRTATALPTNAPKPTALRERLVQMRRLRSPLPTTTATGESREG